jgi:hypothetical protein
VSMIFSNRQLNKASLHFFHYTKILKMKTLLKNAKRVTVTSLLIVCLLVFSSCSKESIPKCEKWEVEDVGHFKDGCLFSFSCRERTLQLSFCGDGLKEAKAGNTITIGGSDCCKTTRTFIRKVQ